MKTELYLGLDVHKECISTAVAEEGRKGEVRDTGSISNDLHALEKFIARLRKAHGPEVVVHVPVTGLRQTSAMRANWRGYCARAKDASKRCAICCRAGGCSRRSSPQISA